MRAGTTSSPPYSSSPISLSRSLAGPLHRSRSQVGTEVRQGREGKQPYIHPPAICQQSLNLPSSHPLPHPTLETPLSNLARPCSLPRPCLAPDLDSHSLSCVLHPRPTPAPIQLDHRLYFLHSPLFSAYPFPPSHSPSAPPTTILRLPRHPTLPVISCGVRSSVLIPRPTSLLLSTRIPNFYHLASPYPYCHHQHSPSAGGPHGDYERA